MKKVLVTGASGALGVSLVAALGRQNYSVLKTSSRNQDNDSEWLDICDAKQWRKCLEEHRPDMIFHLAAIFGNDFSHAYAVNVESTRLLLEQVLQTEPHTRVVLIGSAAEYGQVKPVENPVPENRQLRPISVYGVSKAWQSALIPYYSSRNVNVVMARVFNLLGPNISEKLFVGSVYKQVAELEAGTRQRIEVGSLQAIRDYLPTQLAVAQILAIAKHAPVGSTHHVASGVPISMREVLTGILQANGLNESVLSQTDDRGSHTGTDVPVIFADITATEKLMNIEAGR